MKSEIQSLQLENEKLRQELEACNLEKCRLADSESHLGTEIQFLNQKIKSYEDGNDAKTQIISEVMKLQKTHSSPSKPSQQKTYNIQSSSLQKHTSSDASCEEQDNAINISQQNGTTTKPSSHTVSNHTSYSANKDAQMQNSPSVTYAMVVNSPQENKSCSESKQSHSYNAFTADSKQKSSTLNDVFTNQDRASEVDTDVAAKDNTCTPNSFKGYTFVRKKHTPSKRVVLANIKARDTTFEKVKEDIVSWCHNKNVNVFSIILLANHSARRYPTFVIRVNIDEKNGSVVLIFINFNDSLYMKFTWGI